MRVPRRQLRRRFFGFTMGGADELSGYAFAISVTWALAFTAFVGLNLLQSGFTGFCPPEKLLAKMGFKRGDGVSCGS